MATNDEVAGVLGTLMLAYPAWGESLGSKIDGTLEIYRRALMDIDGKLLESAVLQHIGSSKWFPTISELREAALSIVTHGDESAEEAWIEVIEAIHKIGSYGKPQWSNDMIERTIKAFGWIELCMTETDQMSYARDSFMKIYKAQSTRRRESNLMLPEVKNAIEKLAESKRLRALGSPAESRSG